MTLVACGGGSPDTSGKSVVNNSGPAPLSTVAGTPVGGQSSATIGTSGGTLSALEESLTLTIPAGALASADVISIQPITNTAPGGLGSGYRLAPAGTVFKRPLDITFEYSDFDLDDTPAGNLGVVTQTVDGYWRVVEGAVVDERASTITVAVTHFSDFALFKGLGVYPYMVENENGEEEPKRIEYCFDPQEDIEKEVIPADDPSRLDDDPQHEPRYLCFGPFSGQPLPFDEDDYSDADDEEIEQPARIYEGNLRYSVENEGISVTLSGDVTWLEGDAGSDGFLASGKMNFSVTIECTRRDDKNRLLMGEAKFNGDVGFQGEMNFGVPADGRYTFALGTNWDDAQLVCNGISVPYGVLFVSGSPGGTAGNESLLGDGRLLKGSIDIGDGIQLEWSFARTK
ncbi:MAG: hypothetical protein MUP90_02750 [Gammaproteobacteria bacterium]|nr:hypothetical protein [Gammaproteobacteria bacterium]